MNAKYLFSYNFFSDLTYNIHILKVRYSCVDVEYLTFDILLHATYENK